MSDPAVLPARAEVVVVGGGVMGTSIAFHLAEAGVRDVLLLERDALGSGSTSKAAGGVRAQFSRAVNVELGKRSLVAFEDFARRPGAQIDLHQPGYLFLVTDPDDVPVFEASVALQNGLGVPSVLLTAAQARELAPAMRTDDVLAASFHPRDGYCSPEAVVAGYAAGARRHGATLRTGVRVRGVRVDGGAVRGVVTDAGEVATRAVVCAAGAWSRPLAATAGVDLPVVPLRRQIVVTQPLDATLAALLPTSMPMTIDVSSTFYAHREGPAVLLGMSWAGEEPGERLGYSPQWLPDLAQALEHRCPALADAGIAHSWAGLYEVTPDHDALVGAADEVAGFWYATGFSGHGFLMGPAIGEVVRDLYLGREPVVDVSALSARRFAGGATRGERNIV